MHWFIEQFGAVTAAENCCHTLHNTYSIRGTQDPRPAGWSKYLEQTIELWGDRAEVMYGMHHWPVWGRDRVLELLGKGRDGYRFINDETLRLANHGLTPERDRRAGRVPAKRSSATGRCAATTARSTTTSRRPTSTTWAGSTATRPPSTRTRRRRPPSATSSSWAAPTRCSTRRAARSSWATTAGSPRSSTTSCSPTPTTRPPGSCRPTRSSSSATRPSRARGATST